MSSTSSVAETAVARVLDQLTAHPDGLDVLRGVADLRADVEREAAHAHAEPAREFEQVRHGRGLAAELAREVDDRGRVAERQPQQQLGAPPVPAELVDLVGVVRDERANAEPQRRGDVGVRLDGVRVDAAVRRRRRPTGRA